MRYAKYNYYVDPQTGLKTLPTEVDGVCFITPDEFELVGYLDEDADVALLSNWSLSEISETEFFDLLVVQNPDVVMVDGRAVFPLLVTL
jgi:hypothetical protein